MCTLTDFTTWSVTRLNTHTHTHSKSEALCLFGPSELSRCPTKVIFIIIFITKLDQNHPSSWRRGSPPVAHTHTTALLKSAAPSKAPPVCQSCDYGLSDGGRVTLSGRLNAPPSGLAGRHDTGGRAASLRLGISLSSCHLSATVLSLTHTHRYEVGCAAQTHTYEHV